MRMKLRINGPREGRLLAWVLTCWVGLWTCWVGLWTWSGFGSGWMFVGAG